MNFSEQETQKLLKGIDVNEIVKRIALQNNFFGEDGIFTPLIKTIVEKAISAEIDSFIAQEPNLPPHINYSS
ncbi:hypothetical protein [Desulfurella sp.]|uniref:hypothetical protein n=1 Tax=Desulfurella sp. TaxID=1962857 RepID=UPI0025BB6409|nr:hypothetical protein [Desulfurella sp.]